MKAIEVYVSSDGDATKAFYADLESRGPIGIVAVNLFRAQKCSSRAKVYRGGLRGQGSFKRMAYDRKRWSMENLCKILDTYGELLNVRHGWKADPETVFGERESWVLYVDLPQGQVSFHSPDRLTQTDYEGDWDRSHKSAERVIEFCDSVLSGGVCV